MVRYRTFSVYFMTNKLYGTLYTGVTSDLVQRVSQHREASMQGFTKRYNLKRLVWYEHQPNADAAILREKRVKRWDRDWKIALVEAMNPTWDDLWPRLLREGGFAVGESAEWLPEVPGLHSAPLRSARDDENDKRTE